MSISRCHSGLAGRRFLLAFVSLAFASFGLGATAQTAPQLLPYTVKLIAGSGTAAIAAGGTCPASGLKSLDAYGDGCLATEISIGPTLSPSVVAGTGARYAVADKTGAVFFSDPSNGLVRRIDPITGIVTAVAGGAASNPASGTACGTLTSTDSDGDGCLSTAVKLGKPMGLAFSAAGDLYFADNSFDDIRKVAATGGLVTTGGIITNIAGGSTFGYNVNNAAGPVNASTQSLLNFPYGVAFDSAGNLYVADEGNNAIEVINLTSATETIQGLTVPAGTIAKFSGYGNLNLKSASATECPVFTAAVTGSRGGCYFGKWVDGTAAATTFNDGVYSLAVDASGNVYFGNEFNDNVGVITSANIISNYAGIQSSILKDITKRGAAGSFGIGSIFGVAIDPLNNLYVADASSGVIWRVDGTPGHTMYAIAGGATTVCAAATDANGDGCSGLQAKLGSSGTSFASTTLPGPGVFGVSADANANLYIGDTETGVIREISSGTQFGNVGATQTYVVDVHFAANDSAAAGGYKLTSGGSIFSLGTVSCTTNSDKTTDCLLPITATPSVLGAFTGTLQVQSQLNGTSTFPLSGNFVQSPITRSVIAAGSAAYCSGSTTYAPTVATTLTASLVANGPSAPTGSFIFYANGTALAPTAGVPVSNIGTTAAPVYGAILSYTFSTPGTYAITAVYSGDGYFKTSTSTAPASVTISSPAFTTSAINYQQSTVTAGQSGLYSFNVAQTVYSGTISFAVAGLPANSSAVFNPATVSATGCSTTNTVALSIVTQQGATALQSSFGVGRRGIWAYLTSLLGLGMALMLGLRRRRSPLRYGTFWMALALLLAASGTVACSNAVTAATRTPSGTYNITVTATGSAGTTTTFNIPLTVK